MQLGCVCQGAPSPTPTKKRPKWSLKIHRAWPIEHPVRDTRPTRPRKDLLLEPDDFLELLAVHRLAAGGDDVAARADLDPPLTARIDGTRQTVAVAVLVARIGERHSRFVAHGLHLWHI